MRPLISHIELAERLGQVALFDIRWSLTDPGHGRSDYEKGHIPGAVFVDLDRDLSARPGISGRHPLPSVGELAATLGELGVEPEKEVVAYDDAYGAIAARLWWMLRSIGHLASRLLDGGYQTWLNAGHPIEAGSNSPVATHYPTPDSFRGVATMDGLKGRPLVDVRAEERYTGEREPVDPKAGHIPGAISLPYSGNLGDDGTFLSADELERRYADIGSNAIVSCGSGVTSCHAALAMTLAGRDMPYVYVGSFSEWSRRDMPIRTGTAP